ncbi:MAG: hypothetical protein ACPGUV_08680, partial [Polyangiales bacterium]
MDAAQLPLSAQRGWLASPRRKAPVLAALAQAARIVLRHAGRWLVPVLGLVACGNDRTLVTPPSMQRPLSVAFACFQQSDGAALPLSACQGVTESQANPAQILTALVTQSTRGEIGVVDLTQVQLIDTDRRVPGFTFTIVDEVPSDILVPETRAQVTYIAHRAARTVIAVDTASFGPQPERGTGLLGEVVLPAAPEALALSSDERLLFVALPQRGALMQISLEADGRFGALRELPLSAPAPLPAPTLPAPDARRYEKLCPPQTALLPAPAPTLPAPVGDPAARPRPVDLVFDGEAQRLLVADAAQPVLHVLPVGPDGVQATAVSHVPTGAPLRQVVLTPRVPATLASTVAERRYVYGIDADSGTVLVLDASQEPASSWPLLPFAQATRRQDRLPLDGIAQTLTVLRPDYPAGGLCADGNVRSDSLRGVFVAVALADGTVRVVDVYDLDAACRGGADCAPPSLLSEPNVFLRRHHPRLFGFDQPPVLLDAIPELVFNSAPLRIADDGRTLNAQSPVLGEVSDGMTGACPIGMVQVFPPTSTVGQPARICALVDPWSGRAERWQLSYEGPLPGASGGRGRLSATGPGAGSSWLLDDSAHFCAAGVLGRTDVPTDGAEAGYGGDRLVIDSPLPEAAAARPECQVFATTAVGTRIEVAFAIEAAYDGALSLAPTSIETAIAFRLAADCFREALTYAVQSRAAYTVVGAASGFVHRVETQGGGRCGIDPNQPYLPGQVGSYRSSRAVPG